MNILALAIVVLDVIAIIDVLKSSIENSKKALWILLIVALPFAGMVIYFLLGKNKR